LHSFQFQKSLEENSTKSESYGVVIFPPLDSQDGYPTFLDFHVLASAELRDFSMAKIAINGLGRIGRAALKIALDHPALDLVAINNLVPPDNLAYLLRHDTAYGRYNRSVEAEGDRLVIDGKPYPVFSQKDPAQLPWGDLNVDVVLECTGVFTKRDGLEKHLQAGAKQVVLSAPAKSDGVETVVHGVNQASEDADIISTASCTTNCITPVVEVMSRRIGVKKAMMTTVHAYTSSQGIVDAPSKKYRRGRAAAANFVPTSTGAAILRPRFKDCGGKKKYATPAPIKISQRRVGSKKKLAVGR
jgi:glyceraldehyde 3-phosphate dehydrogenase